MARHWIGYLRKVAFRLRAKLCVDVTVRQTGKERGDIRLQSRNAIDAGEGSLNGSLRIKDAAGNVGIKLIVPSRSVQYILEVSAPTEGRQATRVRWLAKQLKGDILPKSGLDVTTAWSPYRGLTTRASGQAYLEDLNNLCLDKNGAPVPRDASPRNFRITWTRSLGKSINRSERVLENVSKGLEEFYHNVVQDIVPFVPRAPRISDAEPTPEIHTQDAPEDAALGATEESANTDHKGI